MKSIPFGEVSSEEQVRGSNPFMLFLAVKLSPHMVGPDRHNARIVWSHPIMPITTIHITDDAPVGVDRKE
jgi:hypothetical protein